MAGIPTLDADETSLSTLREFWFFTLARLIAEGPLTASLAADYTAFGLKLDACIQHETQLDDGIITAQATAFVVDRGLNGILQQVSSVIHAGKKVDITLPLHVLFFGNQTPFEAARPTLGSQLDLMELWPQKLTQSSLPALQGLAAPTTAGVASGTAARDGLKLSTAANAKFRLDGERRQVFDEYNALAAATHGAIRAIQLDHPELKLPSDWADSLFRHNSRDPGPRTSAEADVLIAKLQAEIDALKAERDALAKAEADAAAAETDAAHAQAALDDAQKAEDAAIKKRKDAEEALKKAKKKAKK